MDGAEFTGVPLGHTSQDGFLLQVSSAPKQMLLDWPTRRIYLKADPPLSATVKS